MINKDNYEELLKPMLDSAHENLKQYFEMGGEFINQTDLAAAVISEIAIERNVNLNALVQQWGSMIKAAQISRGLGEEIKSVGKDEHDE